MENISRLLSLLTGGVSLLAGCLLLKTNAQEFVDYVNPMVIARNNSEENVYIQSVTLNGKKINRLWITHQEITQGGVLEFVMGKYPNKQLKGNL